MSSEEPCYTIIGSFNNESPTEQDLKAELEKGSDQQKIKSLQSLIKGLIAGSKYPNVLMHVIRFVLPSRNHTLKKLLLIYFEIVPKLSNDGKLLPQMILVCDAYRRDLEHPNEYIRGATLRFLCKLREAELLEPLMPSIQANLEHKNSYVRRNAVLCIFRIYEKFSNIIPDGSELIYNYLENEKDMSCRRNAFMMLTNVDQDKAIEYISSRLDQLESYDDILQLIVVELVYKVCRSNPDNRSFFIRSIYQLLSATSMAVRYEATKTLVSLTSAPTAIKAAVKCYLDLVYRESDNNIKLVVLDEVDMLKNSTDSGKIIQENIMDILRCLNAHDLQVRKRVLEITEICITSKNVSEVVKMLRKELAKTSTDTAVDVGYRQLLVKSLHNCAVKFPNIAIEVVPLLLDFLCESNSSAEDVITSVREALEFFPQLRTSTVKNLLDNFSSIKSPVVFRVSLWILGEYCTDSEEVNMVFDTLKECIGKLPIVDAEMQETLNRDEASGEGTTKDEQKMEPHAKTYTKVTSDGTYATQSVFTTGTTDTVDVLDSKTPLRSLLMKGQWYLATVLASCLVKLVFHLDSHTQSEEDRRVVNIRTAEAMLIMASICNLGKSGIASSKIDDDSLDRVRLCIRVLAIPSEVTKNIFLNECHESLSSLLGEKQRNIQIKESELKGEKCIQPDDVISFRMFTSNAAQSDEMAASLAKATGKATKIDLGSKLSQVFQLTGLSDPVYAEAYINVNQYDIVLDILLVNQTEDTLQNFNLELYTMGNLKLLEKLSPLTIAGNSFTTINTNVKVSSSETGIIFGNLVYDISGTSESSIVVLNDIHIDIADYIVPAECDDERFREMWTECEWENKVVVVTDIIDLKEYSKHIIKQTNMKCLTLESGDNSRRDIDEICPFYAVKLYARSVFGEDTLASLSIEKGSDGKIHGHIRIRAKTQGIALSLGDKISLCQRRIERGDACNVVH